MAYMKCPACERTMSIGASGADWQVHDYLNDPRIPPQVLDAVWNRACPYCGQNDQPMTGPHASLKTGKPDIDALPQEERPKFRDEKASQQSGQDIEYAADEVILPHSEIPGTDAWNAMQIWGGFLTDTPRENVATVERDTEIPEDPDEDKKAAFDEVWDEMKKATPVFMPMHYNVNRRHPETGEAYKQGMTFRDMISQLPQELQEVPEKLSELGMRPNRGGYYNPYLEESFVDLGYLPIPEEMQGGHHIAAFLLQHGTPQQMYERLTELRDDEDFDADENETGIMNQIIGAYEDASRFGEMFGDRDEQMMQVFNGVKTQVLQELEQSSPYGVGYTGLHKKFMTDAMEAGADEQTALAHADTSISDIILQSSVHERHHELDHEMRKPAWDRMLVPELEALQTGEHDEVDRLERSKELVGLETPTIIAEEAYKNRRGGETDAPLNSRKRLWEDYIHPEIERMADAHSRGVLSDEQWEEAKQWWRRNEPFGEDWEEVVEGAKRKAGTQMPELEHGLELDPAMRELVAGAPPEVLEHIMGQLAEVQQAQQAGGGMEMEMPLGVRPITRLKQPEPQSQLEVARVNRLLEQGFQRTMGGRAQDNAITDHLQRTDRDPEDEEHRAAAMGELLAQEQLYEPPTELN